jgi:hypothetical protein
MTSGRPVLRSTLVSALLIGLLAAAIVYLATKVVAPDVAGVDLRYLWLAGLLWGEGIDPYSSEYGARSAEFMARGNVPQWLPYPPYWYPWATLLARLPLETAEQLWGLFSGVLILIAGAVFSMAFRTVWRDAGYLPVLMLFIFLAACSPTAQAITVGQTSPLILFGLALYFLAIARQSQQLMCLALIVVMLKPNFGLPFAAYAFLLPRFRMPTLLAAGLSCCAMLPALLPHGPMAVITGYVEVLSGYGEHPANRPSAVTGLVNLTYQISGFTLSGFAAVGQSVLVAILLALKLNKDAKSGSAAAKEALTSPLLLLVSTLFFVPLHTYDLLLVAPILFLPSLLRPRYRLEWAAWGAALLLLFRPNNLAEAAGLVTAAESHFPGSILASVALLVLLLLSLVHFARRGRTSRP